MRDDIPTSIPQEDLDLIGDYIYPKDKQENLAFREKMLYWSLNDDKCRQENLDMCAFDPLYFLNVWCWTYNPRLDDPHLQFITYEFQDVTIRKLVKAIEDKSDVYIEKSRDMGASWMLAALSVWGFLFRGWASLYGSYKEDYVDKQGSMDSYFERCRYIMNRLPKFMKPADIQSKFMSISSETIKANISGDSGKNFGTGGRRKFVILDEFQAWQWDAVAFRKTRDVTNTRVFIGTPEGTSNVYGKLMTKHKDYQHLGGERITLHWKLHPDKDDAWYQNEKKFRTKQDIAKELDISYKDSVVGAVYPHFNTLCSFGDYPMNPELAIYTSWDLGRDMVAIIWFQKDFKTGINYVIDSYQKPIDETSMDITFFTAFITGEPVSGYEYSEAEIQKINEHYHWRHLYRQHFGDPYNSNAKQGFTRDTYAKALAEYKIYLTIKTGANGKRSTVPERIKLTTLGLKSLFIDHNENHEFIEAISNSIYPQVGENSQSTTESEKPVHNKDSHFRTALEYYFDSEPQGQSQKSSVVEAQKAYTQAVTYGNLE